MGDRLIKKGLVIGIIVLFIGSNFVSGLNIQLKNTTIPLITGHGNTLYVGGTGEGNYSKIQDAINDSVDGDTVFVYDDSSPYYEHLIINKSMNLIGENKNTTKIDGKRKGKVIWIQDYPGSLDNGVIITGFTIQKSGSNHSFLNNIYEAGIYINSNSSIIYNNNIIDNSYGIVSCPYGRYVDYFTYNHIFYGNTIKNSNGILMKGSIDYKIFENFISNNVGGISCGDLNPPVIKEASTFSYDEWVGEIYRNTITDNNVGISHFFWGGDDIYENKIMNNQIGIEMFNAYGYSGYDNIFNNSIIMNEIGIEISGVGEGSSDYNYIYQNSIIGNTQGIEISAVGGGSSNNQIYQNNISRNREGILICSYWDFDGNGANDGANDNKIYQNNFIGNLFYNAFDRCNNQWDNGTIGNYWDDYRGKDNDKDGIGDTQYRIRPYWKGNIDNYPLMKPVENITKITSGITLLSQKQLENRESENLEKLQFPIIVVHVREIYGTLDDPQYRPLANVKVKISIIPNWRAYWRGTTDENGTTEEIKVEIGFLYDVFVSKYGYHVYGYPHHKSVGIDEGIKTYDVYFLMAEDGSPFVKQISQSSQHLNHMILECDIV